MNVEHEGGYKRDSYFLSALVFCGLSATTNELLLTCDYPQTIRLDRVCWNMVGSASVACRATWVFVLVKAGNTLGSVYCSTGNAVDVYDPADNVIWFCQATTADTDQGTGPGRDRGQDHYGSSGPIVHLSPGDEIHLAGKGQQTSPHTAQVDVTSYWSVL